MKKISIILLIITIISCNSNEMKPSAVVKKEIPDISSVTVTLPEAAGSEEFKANCLTCHSARYIEMQPDFAKKNWEKIVDKMIKTFGAPISDSAAVKIVNYLVEIKGKK